MGDVTAPDEHGARSGGETPLILAARAGDELSAQILLHARADADAATAKGNTALAPAGSVLLGAPQLTSMVA